MQRVSTYRNAGTFDGEPEGRVVLAHDERHLRRKAITLESGEQVLIDLAQPVAFEAGDILVTEDGRGITVVAAEEPLFEVTARDRLHLVELAWHLGNRHLAAQIDETRILILRDHVIKAMLEGLGAGVKEISAPFSPLRGAYHHAAEHAHDHHHPHGHT
jgi:urease accessory protein